MDDTAQLNNKFSEILSKIFDCVKLCFKIYLIYSFLYICVMACIYHKELGYIFQDKSECLDKRIHEKKGISNNRVKRVIRGSNPSLEEIESVVLIKTSYTENGSYSGSLCTGTILNEYHILFQVLR